MLVLITKLQITQYKLLTATTLRRLYLFLSISPVSYRFFPQVHTRLSLHQKYFEMFYKVGTITNIAKNNSNI